MAMQDLVPAGIIIMVLKVEGKHNPADMLTKYVPASVRHVLNPITGTRNLRSGHQPRLSDIQVSHYPACMWEGAVIRIVKSSGIQPCVPAVYQ